MVKHDNSSGRPRIRCSRVAESGCCDNKRRYYLDRIEAGVLDSLRAELDQPELIAEFVRTYHDERQRLAGANVRARAKDETRLGNIRAQMTRIVDMLAEGGAAFADMRGKMEALEQERREVEARLATADEQKVVVALHPQAVRRFREALDALSVALSNDRPLANQAFRELVAKVIVHPAPAGVEPKIEIIGN
ncbi:zinc ribbon domain-containing protein [Candidatus Rhodoblastus alkanivorans]|nr:zinc ribbon domain-containing protein [Candidatus Rhodoblastus alkanivorans]